MEDLESKIFQAPKDDKERIERGFDLVKYVKENAGASGLDFEFTETFRFKVRNGASADIDTYYVFSQLIKYNKQQSIVDYINCGADANVKNNFNITPLMVAALERSKDINNKTYITILNYGADPHIENTLLPKSYSTPAKVLLSIPNLSSYEEKLIKERLKYAKKIDDLTK